MGKRSAKDRQAGSSLAANQCATNKELAAVGVHHVWWHVWWPHISCVMFHVSCVVAPYFMHHVMSTYITTNPFYCFASTAVVAACILMPWLYFVWAVYFCDQINDE